MSRTDRVASFPHISTSEFESGSEELAQLFAKLQHAQHEWLSADITHRGGATYLKITRPLEHSIPIPENIHAVSEANEVEEEDEEALPIKPSKQVLVEYDIIHSPSYQVPVLYFSIKDPSFRFPPTMEETLYRYLIPSHFRTQAERIGVIGGITVTDHPITNSPVFFIHPCQTAALLEASVDTNEVTPLEYLVLWIGAICKFVGLNVPINLAVKARPSTSSPA